MKIVRPLLGLTLALAAAWPAPADAFSCRERAATFQRYKTVDVIFVGLVTRVGPDEAEAPGQGRRREYATLRVEEAFRGIDRDTSEVRFLVRHTTVSVRFQEGRRYIVYADRGEGGLETSGCHNTRQVEEAASDLTYLRGVAEGKRLGTIYGRAIMRTGDDEATIGDLFAPDSARVVAEGEAGRFEVEHEYGWFELNVPPGVYRLSVEGGSDVEVRRPSPSKERFVEVEAVEGQGTEVEVVGTFKYR
jgi:hypothetical protein